MCQRTYRSELVAVAHKEVWIDAICPARIRACALALVRIDVYPPVFHQALPHRIYIFTAKRRHALADDLYRFAVRDNCFVLCEGCEHVVCMKHILPQYAPP